MTRATLALAAMALVAVGCSRKSADESHVDASPSAAVASPSAAPDASAPLPRTSITPIEARRSRVTAFDRSLSLAPASVAALEKHFAGHTAVDVQEAEL